MYCARLRGLHRDQSCWHAGDQSHDDPPATIGRNGPSHAEVTGSQSTGAGRERHREKVITDSIGKDESIY